MSNYPKCPECGHDQHGLPCDRPARGGTQGVGSGYSYDLCGCDAPIAPIPTGRS